MSDSAPRPQDSALGTRERLVLAAERLFAERGIEAVSLREINLAAGQRNKSAVHYHFGGKAELIEAIFAHRMPVVDALRHERMDALEAAGGETPLHELVAAIVYPLAEQIDGQPGGSHYVRFLGQLEHDPQKWVLETFRGKYDRGARRALGAIARALPLVPERILAQRLDDAVAFYVRALGDREQRLAQGRSSDREQRLAQGRSSDRELPLAQGRSSDRELPLAQGRSSDRELPLALFVSNLVDAISGMLAAPVSDATQAELERDPSPQRASL